MIRREGGWLGGAATAALWIAFEEHRRTGKKVFCKYCFNNNEYTYLTAEKLAEELLALNEGKVENVSYATDKLTFRRQGDRRLFCYGVDYGRLPQIKQETQSHLLLYVQGHVGWAGIGYSKYYEPQLMLLRKISDDGLDIQAERLWYQWYDRAGRKQAYDTAARLLYLAELESARGGGRA